MSRKKHKNRNNRNNRSAQNGPQGTGTDEIRNEGGDTTRRVPPTEILPPREGEYQKGVRSTREVPREAPREAPLKAASPDACSATGDAEEQDTRRRGHCRTISRKRRKAGPRMPLLDQPRGEGRPAGQRPQAVALTYRCSPCGAITLRPALRRPVRIRGIMVGAPVSLKGCPSCGSSERPSLVAPDMMNGAVMNEEQES